MNTIESDHDWFSDHIASYLTGGLSAAEGARFESHRDTCPTCADELHHFQEMEHAMTTAFADAMPGTDFEDRITSRLSKTLAPPKGGLTSGVVAGSTR